MKRVLVDTNVVLDVLLNRQPHVVDSRAILLAIDTRIAEGFLSAHAVTTIHYFLRRELDRAGAYGALDTLLKIFKVAAVDGQVIQAALRSPEPDFEDAVTAAAADFAKCNLIVTRDPKGFRSSSVQALTPDAALPLLRGI